jgi:hypothetical protein
MIIYKEIDTRGADEELEVYDVEKVEESFDMTPEELANELKAGGCVKASMQFWCWNTILTKRVHFYETYADLDYFTGRKTYISWFLGKVTEDEAKELARLMGRPRV